MSIQSRNNSLFLLRNFRLREAHSPHGVFFKNNWKLFLVMLCVEVWPPPLVILYLLVATKSNRTFFEFFKFWLLLCFTIKVRLLNQKSRAIIAELTSGQAPHRSEIQLSRNSSHLAEKNKRTSESAVIPKPHTSLLASVATHAKDNRMTVLLNRITETRIKFWTQRTVFLSHFGAVAVFFSMPSSSLQIYPGFGSIPYLLCFVFGFLITINLHNKDYFF